MHRRIALTLLLGLGGLRPAHAQDRSPVVGAWERISTRNFKGESPQPPEPPAFLVFTADGYWAQLAIPPSRPRIKKTVGELTKEELVARFQDLEARHGTYSIEGKTLTRRNVASADPGNEGTEQVQMFRIEGELLIFNSPDPASKGEARFHRLK